MAGWYKSSSDLLIEVEKHASENVIRLLVGNKSDSKPRDKSLLRKVRSLLTVWGSSSLKPPLKAIPMLIRLS